MADAKHTPGPWAVLSLDGIERGADVITADGTQDICNCYPWDARLISAAPQLLESLQMIVRGYGVKFEDAAIRDAARAAIAAATGEQP